MPPGYINGLDVSDNNGTVNWATVANQGYKFAFIKATEGITFTDSTFATNWASAKQNNILRGAYHYFRANDDPVAQANHFLQVVPSLAPSDLPPVLDLEDDAKGTVTGTALLNAVQQWLTQVEEGLNRTLLIYVSPGFWQSSLANGQNPNRFSSHYPLWIAQWTQATHPNPPDGWTTWTFWQFSATGHVTGVGARNSNVDLDRFNGSLANLRALAGL